MIGTIAEAKTRVNSGSAAAPAKQESKPTATPALNPAAGLKDGSTRDPQSIAGAEPQAKIEHAADTHES